MSPVPAFAFTSGNPDRLVGGQPAVMSDIQGPFYDLRAYLNGQIAPTLNTLSPPVQSLLNAPVLDVGMLGQIRAGRQLTVADFTAAGLPAPLGLWNLTDLTDASGNGRALTNKGAVAFAPGINGIAGTAAVYAGVSTQALYINDTGAADPFRLKTGTVACWFRTAKRGATQYLAAKAGASGTYAWDMFVSSTNGFAAGIYPNGTVTGYVSAVGTSDVSDDRWHFGVAVFDGATISVYVDGVLETRTLTSALPFAAATGPLDIGGFGADGGSPALGNWSGRIDEAFITDAVLSEDQVRALYCAKIAHGYTSAPTRMTLNVRRRKRGGVLVQTDFPAQPMRLYNFTAGALNDEGSGGVALGVVGAGALVVTGADGTPSGSYALTGAQSLASTDAGLPAGTALRSYGLWFKTMTSAGNMGLLCWGTTPGVNDERLSIAVGQIASNSAADSFAGPFVADGGWHFAVVVEDNGAADGLRRKLYLDGRLVGSTTVLGSVVLGGASRFRVGAYVDGTAPFTGQTDGVFVYAGALTPEQVATLYAKGSQALLPSPKNAGDHIEAMDATNVYAIFDTLDSTALIDLGVAA